METTWNAFNQLCHRYADQVKQISAKNVTILV